MCFKKETEKPVSVNEEKDIALEEDDIEEVSGGVKWGDGERPTLKDAAKNDRHLRK